MLDRSRALVPDAKALPAWTSPRFPADFRSRRQEQGLTNRIPPGQYVTTDFPVLSAGPTPQIRLEEWTFGLQPQRIAARQVDMG